jgi:hypothetical protein
LHRSKQKLQRSIIEINPINSSAKTVDLDFNDAKNLIPLPETRHLGSHNSYTDAVEDLINKIKVSGNFSTDKAVIEEALRRVRKTIEHPSQANKKINEIISLIR